MSEEVSQQIKATISKLETDVKSQNELDDLWLQVKNLLVKGTTRNKGTREQGNKGYVSFHSTLLCLRILWIQRLLNYKVPGAEGN